MFRRYPSRKKRLPSNRQGRCTSILRNCYDSNDAAARYRPAGRVAHLGHAAYLGCARSTSSPAA